MTLSYVHGDLFDSGSPAIAHGVNCRGVMGAGIAVGFKQRYPTMYQHYQAMCDQGHLILGQVFPWYAEHERPVIFNLATQIEPGPNARYSGVMQSVDTMLLMAQNKGISQVAIPQIGCGIGGLEWPQVEGILLALTEKYPAVDVVVYVFP